MTRLLAASALGAALLAGCATTETSSPAGGSTAPASPGAGQSEEEQNRQPDRPLSEALLPASALPPDLQYQQINEFPDLSDAFANAVVQPPQCGTTEALQPYGNPSELEAAVQVGNGPPGTLIAGLIRGPGDLDLSSTERTLQQCPTFTIQTPEVSLTAQQEKVPAPDVDADEVIAYRQTVATQGAAAPTQETLHLAAVDDGVVVLVASTFGDPALLEDLLRKALQRKKEILG